jgi:pimeloyl-ACP methyl ester carboxylesterase
VQSQVEVRHRHAEIGGVRVFYRECGREDAPALLLPHGYPCSSYEFRNLMTALGDRWRLLAPDFPGFGYSATPDEFDYGFDGYAGFLERFTDRMRLQRYALYLHDYGSQIGLRLAMRHPDRIAALVLQNGDIYEDALGPKYAGLLSYFDAPTEHKRAALLAAVSEDGYREEFLNEVDERIAERIAPDLWRLHWALTTPKRRQIGVALMEGLKENLTWFPRYQAYLRDHQPPTLIVWGPRDGYMPEASARAYLRDLPHAELHMLADGGHWLLETHLDHVASLMREFLGRVHPNPRGAVSR